MMREEFAIIVAAMKAVYVQDTFIPDKDAFNVWFSLLGDLEYSIAHLAVQKYMLTEHFPPTIADIREQAAVILSSETNELNENEAWQLVRKASSNGYYGAKEEFDKLPTAVQRTVGSPEAIREMSQMNIDSLDTVEKSHFIRVYRMESQRMKDEAKLPPAMKQLIDQVSQKIGLKEKADLIQIGDETK